MDLVRNTVNKVANYLAPQSSISSDGSRSVKNESPGPVHFNLTRESIVSKDNLRSVEMLPLDVYESLKDWARNAPAA